MKIFHCDHCGQLLFFENTECVACGHRVAYLPDLRLVASLDEDGSDRWRAFLPGSAENGYRLCRNDKIERICNWAVSWPTTTVSCVSCRTTRVIPNLSDPANRVAWYRLEVAKRRLLFTLIELGLPIAACDRRFGTGTHVRISRGHRSGWSAGPDRSRRRRHHRQHRGSGRCRARERDGRRCASRIGRCSDTCGMRAVTTTGIV